MSSLKQDSWFHGCIPGNGVGSAWRRSLESQLTGGFLLLALTASQAVSAGSAAIQYPLLMGMNIGAKHYGDPAYQVALARLDVVILGFYRGWTGPGGMAIKTAVHQIKERNAGLRVGQYTVLSESQDDPGDPALADVRDTLTASNWWLRNAAGARVQWTDRYRAWEIDFTEFALADARGRRYPQWRAQRDAEVFFEADSGFDIWYVDNVVRVPRVRADWQRVGRDTGASNPVLAAAWRRGYVAHVAAIRSLKPDVLVMANSDGDLSEPEFRQLFNGAFMEAVMGESWSLERRAGWHGLMNAYRTTHSHLLPPAMIGFNVHGDPSDRRLLRFSLASCLMGDGHYSFTDAQAGHSSVPWFPEFDMQLGQALEPWQIRPQQGRIYLRRFEGGLVAVNPGLLAASIRVGPDYEQLLESPGATSQSRWVAAPEQILIGARDGLLLRFRRH